MNKRGTEEYVVRFWMTNEKGFKTQSKESVFLHSKNQHQKAENAVIKKYRKEPFCQKIEIVSVVYQ